MKEKHLTTLHIKNLLLPDWKAPEEVYYELEDQAKRCGISVLRPSSGAETAVLGMALWEILSPETGAGDGCK